jgi:serine/threonine protein kinase
MQLEINVIEVSAKETEFLSNEAMEGEPLAERLANGGLSAEEALRYALDIGAALNRAHKRGAIHGKLSPHAILLTAGGARIVRPAEGKDGDALAYRSPEQVAGEAPDWRSDIFSFGTLLYEMVSGRRAFSGEGATLDRAILEKPPATLMGKSPIHAAMEGVIAGCIEKDPARRRQRVQNAVIELRLTGRSLPRIAKAQAETQPQPRQGIDLAPRPETTGMTGDGADIPPKRPRTFPPVAFPDEIQTVPGKARRQRITLWLLLGVSILLLASGAWILWQLSHPQPAPVVKFPV